MVEDLPQASQKYSSLAEKYYLHLGQQLLSI